jgi:hypothetical protein
MQRRHLFIASILAASIPALFFLALGIILEPNNHWAVPAMVVAFIFSLAHILLVGIPITLLLRKYQRLNWVSMIFSGFIVGCISCSILILLTSYESSGTSYKAGSEWLVINGSLTVEGWKNHAMSVLRSGALGSVVSGVYYAVLSKIGSTRKPKSSVDFKRKGASA